MRRSGVALWLGLMTAVGFFATAALHATGYHPVTALAQQGPADLQALMPALWISFSADLVVVGIVVAIVAFRQGAGAALILVAASLMPFAAAGLQLRFLGFIPPTGLLLGLGGLTLLAAVAHAVAARRART